MQNKAGRTYLLLSIHPVHVGKIAAGSKTIELRRTRPRVTPGDVVVVYASAPTKAAMGEFVVKKLHVASPHSLWEKMKDSTGITRAAFRNYFNGSKVAFGIEVQAYTSYARPIDLDDIRKKWPKFIPPQVYHYLSKSDFSNLTGRGTEGRSQK